MAKKREFMQHWPVISLALVVLGIFLAACVSFQVQEYEVAIVKTFGEARKDADGRDIIYKPGLHWQWPAPIDQVWRHDNRLQCYELETRIEQIQTKDDYMIMVTTFVLWRVGNPGLFMRAVNTSASAEDKITDLVRSSRSSVFGQRLLSQLIQVRDLGETAATKDGELGEIEAEILGDVRGQALDDFGIEIVHVGTKHLGFPEEVTSKVFSRMIAERGRKAQEHISEGKSRATEIHAEADRSRRELESTAEAKAKRIRGAAEAVAAGEYKVFAKNPELAIFLRQLDALDKTFGERDTLILDTNSPLFSILGADAMKFAIEAAKKADKKADKKGEEK
jgi:modulator of FtsH protease HflC